MSAKLEAKIAELEEELLYYRSLYAPPPKELYGHLREKGFVPREIKVMILFAKRQGVSADAIRLALGEETSHSYPNVVICTLRSKLKPFGIKLKTVRSYGWTIEEESQAKLQSLLNPNPPISSPSPDPLRAAFNRAKLRGL
jgi:hypothetical protein